MAEDSEGEGEVYGFSHGEPMDANMAADVNRKSVFEDGSLGSFTIYGLTPEQERDIRFHWVDLAPTVRKVAADQLAARASVVQEYFNNVNKELQKVYNIDEAAEYEIWDNSVQAVVNLTEAFLEREDADTLLTMIDPERTATLITARMILRISRDAFVKVLKDSVRAKALRLKTLESSCGASSLEANAQSCRTPWLSQEIHSQ